MRTCPYCGMPYGRTYEEHTGQPKHKAAIAKAVGRTDSRPEWVRRMVPKELSR